MKLAAVFAFGVACAALNTAEAAPRTLTFDERVNAQTAIERVYYSHQLGATKPFEEAVPRSVIENKVHRYLELTSALTAYWNNAVTDAALQRELARMAHGTRMPERLVELYAALGNDSFLIKETLARATLVERLSHSFYAFDPTLHLQARFVAEALRRRLVSGELSATTEQPNRTVTRTVLSVGVAPPSPDTQPSLQQLTPDEFKKKRVELPASPGQPTAIQETADAFSFSVLLSESAGELRVANYIVPKIPWDGWWLEARATLSAQAVTAVASSPGTLPLPAAVGPVGTSGTCPGDDTWEQWVLREVPTARRNHSAVWTGTVMVVWGGTGASGLVDTGSRYDPATDTWLATSTADAPSPRQFHRAVWTGASMVVWGGRGVANAAFNAGGRYDPSTDSWLPVSVVDAPAVRTGHTAVWTGTRMIIWGGSDASGFSQTGARYDPVNDSWAAMSSVAAPAARSGHTAVWTGTVMVVWGGSTLGDPNSGGRYDPSSDTWTGISMVGVPAGRVGHTAVWTGTAMIVWGGRIGGVYSSTGGQYDPAADAWSSTATLDAPSGRTGQQAVWTGSRMVVWGGNMINPSGESIDYFDTGGRYDPATDSWTATPQNGAPSPRTGHSMIWTGSSVIVWGGYQLDLATERDVYFDTGGRYDPTTDSWTPTSLAGTPRARTAHSAIWTGNVMVVWGGTNGNTDFNTGGRYDPVIDDWAGLSTLNAPSGRYLHSAVWTGHAMVVWGGAGIAPPSERYLDTGGTYDPIADTWASISTIGAPTGRCGQQTVWTGTEMLVWSGFVGGSPATYPITGGRYNPSTDTWGSITTQGAPSGRYYASAVWTGRFMLVWGGEGSGHTLPSTGGRYDPATDRWTPTSLSGAPVPRWVHSTVWTGRLMVVWGGFPEGVGEVQSGGRYDPTANAWTATSTLNAPSPRGGHQAVWTGREMVLWGGYGGGYLATGGRYDPATDAWTATSTAGAPPARTDHSAVWDGKEMLAWGGYEDASPWTLVDTGGSYSATPGESCNGQDDDCDGAVDDGGDGLCDDGNPCTDDACHGSAGCEHVANQVSCDDGNPCTASDTCGGGDCLGTPLTGTACDDGNACTTDDRCASGECAGGPPLVCEDGNLCTDDSCDPATGCTVVGPRLCDDVNVCTDDSCDPATGCVFAPNTNGCDDNSYCTHADHCENGRCVAETPCEDFNPCTDDVCNWWGCSWVPNSHPCDDRHECTVDDVCRDGWCQGTQTYGTPCDDHNACSTGDVCQGFYCAGSYSRCDDDNPCTEDDCNPSTGACSHVNNDAYSCTDNDSCSLGESCHAGICGGSTALDCFACPEGFEQLGMLCRKSYDILGYDLFNQGHACDFDASNRYNDCQGGSYGFRYVDRGENLIPIDVDLRFNSGISCDSGVSGVSLNGSPIGTFTPLGSCLCFPELQSISFGDLDLSAYAAGEINEVSIAPGGGCEGLSGLPDLQGYFARVTVTYARHDRRCEVGACTPATGVCSYSALPDGSACGGACSQTGVCAGGVCSASAISCDDDNVCTDDSCDPTTGCIHAPNGNSCNDGNPCTAGDTCSIGACLGGPAIACDDQNPCTDDSCDPATGCAHAPVAGDCDDANDCTSSDRCVGGHCVGTPETGSPCIDRNACLTGDLCEDGVCRSGTGIPDCDDHNVCTYDWCNPEVGCVNDSSQVGDLCDDLNPCTANACDPELYCVFPPANAGASCDDFDSCTSDDRCDANGTCLGRSLCDDDNPCTDDYAAGASCACSHEPTYPGTRCSDGDACTEGEACDGNGAPGSCTGGTLVNCDDGNPCTTDTCDPTSGCVHTNSAAPCDDGNACTRTDACVDGACVGSNPVVCAPSDACHAAGSCDSATGGCSSVPRPDGAGCDDGDPCTIGETCRSGACTPGASGSSEANPRTNGYYKRLCHGPHSGDHLEDADALCVAALTHTFAGLSTVADLCAELEPAQPNGDSCDRTDDDLMVLALNICRARVCAAQRIDSQCGGGSTVGQSLAASDAILSGSRNDAACAQAKCLDEEVNTGRALDLNTLTLRREVGGLRLDWRPPYLQDGTSRPRQYNVWRRPQGSMTPFEKLGSPVDPTFLDTATESGAFEYEVTAVID